LGAPAFALLKGCSAGGSIGIRPSLDSNGRLVFDFYDRASNTPVSIRTLGFHIAEVRDRKVTRLWEVRGIQAALLYKDITHQRIIYGQTPRGLILWITAQPLERARRYSAVVNTRRAYGQTDFMIGKNGQISELPLN
jgi:hypothetical protein